MKASSKADHLLDDGLITPEIGPWGERKYQLVSQYARMFASSMKRKWDCRVYIDLFAGAGRSKIRGTERIILASPLLALEIPDRFNVYIFCEEDEAKRTALETRMLREGPGVAFFCIQGDCNSKVNEIASKIPQAGKNHKVLCFCFADPYKMKNLHFSTIESLAQRFIDFLILIPTGMDANRNVDLHYLRPSDKTVDTFLGASEWREKWLRARHTESFGVFLTNMYGRRMQDLRYNYEGIQRTQLIRGTEKNLPLYRLAFFSRHNLGEKFWNEAKKYSDPQTTLFDLGR
jgi:three-Cys-motif partner protein